MRPGLNPIAERLAADFPVLPEHGLSRILIVEHPEFGTSLAYGAHVWGSIDTPDAEIAVAAAANYFQDVVIDNLMHTWPEADGRPLFPAIDAGRAWWMRDGARFALIGRLGVTLRHAPIA